MIKILHTADWHIGQLFFEYDRTFEHQSFLNWLLKTLREDSIDVLLVAGDVFDLANPSAVATKMFYHFLSQAMRENPGMQIVITAGNHDSASRLESPKPLLESSDVYIVGVVPKLEDGTIDYAAISIPMRSRDGQLQAICMAVPFLRIGDYPQLQEVSNPYEEGVKAFYDNHYQFIKQTEEFARLPIVALGHLHARQAEISDADKIERSIMGGVECVSAAAFPSGIQYVGLGHIHKAQRIGGEDHVRYSGSPIPMSFSELNYKHQVMIVALDTHGICNLTSKEVPLAIPILRVPKTNAPLETVLQELSALPQKEGSIDLAPYLEVRVLADGPEPSLRYKVEKVLEDKYVRLAKIDLKYRRGNEDEKSSSFVSAEELGQLNPEEVFEEAFKGKYGNEVPGKLLTLFREVSQSITSN